jgi:threonine/homoserine/homoserine lactone efflux protein
MTALTLVAFTLVSLIGIATPGPTVLLALTNGSRFGMRRAGFGMAGAMLSDVVLSVPSPSGSARCWRRRRSGSPS